MSNDELEFLPAALEIQETPPLPASRYILWTIMLFFTLVIVWASIGEVDIVGVAQGKIVPSGRVKIIQPLETGVVRNIYVKEGEHVEKGQTLIELDTTLTGADHKSIKEQQLALKLDKARLISLLDRIGKSGAEDQKKGIGGQGPWTNDQGLNPDPRSLIPEDVTPDQIRIMKQRLQTQLNEYHARVEALKDEKKQRQAEYGAVAQRIQQLDATIPLISERVKSLEDLLKKDMVPRVQWLELEQGRIEQVKERDIQKSNLAMLDASIANITQREAALKAEFETQLLTELADAENRIAAFEQERVKAEKRMTLQKLMAPVAGTVHQLAVHTIGGVVTPAQELMHIVPGEEAIEVEAWLPNKDIGFVHGGQQAEIKIETFPFTQYGTINAEVLNVSNDATPDEHLGLVYAMRVKMYQTTMKVKEKIVNLTPGMAVTVEVNMGKRRLIEFLLSPLLKYKDEAVRER
ncbi:MAG: HlyD family type I secretion periplasmic adaptor subunit [Gammaproteobacteria bacterium]|nr:HlyD family type I secretion periplasmic adaptor subunit [Gammaproteobacteria bacterium]